MYKWWGATKLGQIVLLENSFHLGIDVRFWMIVLILQLYVTLELVIFGEYCNYRDWENPPCGPCQSQFM